ncbi:MAG: hypothetical protein ACRDUX_30020 [Mycobacterium sp.]
MSALMLSTRAMKLPRADDGTPVGNLEYATACFVAAALAVAVARRRNL